MKATTAVTKAADHYRKAAALLTPINEKLASILEDEGAHIVNQPGDGMCVCYRGGMDNAHIGFAGDLDKLLTLNKDELLRALDRAGI